MVKPLNSKEIELGRKNRGFVRITDNPISKGQIVTKIDHCRQKKDKYSIMITPL